MNFDKRIELKNAQQNNNVHYYYENSRSTSNDDKLRIRIVDYSLRSNYSEYDVLISRKYRALLYETFLYFQRSIDYRVFIHFLCINHHYGD
jgi:hypothetical protein